MACAGDGVEILLLPFWLPFNELAMLGAAARWNSPSVYGRDCDAVNRHLTVSRHITSMPL